VAAQAYRDENSCVLAPLGRVDQPLQAEPGRSYSRKQILVLFGLRFKSSVWQSGFVFRQQRMFLLVTLEKECLQEQFRYRDQFISSDIFQWQTQN